jgi:hypothetical protein
MKYLIDNSIVTEQEVLDLLRLNKNSKSLIYSFKTSIMLQLDVLVNSRLYTIIKGPNRLVDIYNIIRSSEAYHGVDIDAFQIAKDVYDNTVDSNEILKAANMLKAYAEDIIYDLEYNGGRTCTDIPEVSYFMKDAQTKDCSTCDLCCDDQSQAYCSGHGYEDWKPKRGN